MIALNNQDILLWLILFWINNQVQLTHLSLLAENFKWKEDTHFLKTLPDGKIEESLSKEISRLIQIIWVETRAVRWAIE